MSTATVLTLGIDVTRETTLSYRSTVKSTPTTAIAVESETDDSAPPDI